MTGSVRRLLEEGKTLAVVDEKLLRRARTEIKQDIANRQSGIYGLLMIYGSHYKYSTVLVWTDMSEVVPPTSVPSKYLFAHFLSNFFWSMTGSITC